MAEPTQDADSPQYWAVAFIDIMGFRHLLTSMSCQPPTTGSGDRYLKATTAAARAVEVRRNLVGILDRFTALQHRQADPPESFTEEQKVYYKEVGRLQVETARFADSIVFSTCLNPVQGGQLVGMLGLHSILRTCAIGCLYQLAQEVSSHRDIHPLRGGIDMDLGVTVRDLESICPAKALLYSAAQAEAYRLEAVEADWPRILISRGLKEAVDRYCDEPAADDPFQIANRNVAHRVRRMIFRDVDGKWALDFLGSEVRERYEDSAEIVGFVRLARRNVASAYAGYTAEGNTILAGRYSVVRDYIEARFPLWDSGAKEANS
jgi:hypothetical protein